MASVVLPSLPGSSFISNAISKKTADQIIYLSTQMINGSLDGFHNSANLMKHSMTDVELYQMSKKTIEITCIQTFNRIYNTIVSFDREESFNNFVKGQFGEMKKASGIDEISLLVMLKEITMKIIEGINIGTICSMIEHKSEGFDKELDDALIDRMNNVAETIKDELVDIISKHERKTIDLSKYSKMKMFFTD
jgi:hypothetical protein